MIVPKHYENLNVLHENTMPHRAYYMPASKDMGSLVHDREKSDRMELLNGNWKFQFYKSIYDLQEKFYEAGYDTKGFDEIPVPGIWQNYGYEYFKDQCGVILYTRPYPREVIEILAEQVEKEMRKEKC